MRRFKRVGLLLRVLVESALHRTLAPLDVAPWPSRVAFRLRRFSARCLAPGLDGGHVRGATIDIEVSQGWLVFLRFVNGSQPRTLFTNVAGHSSGGASESLGSMGSGKACPLSPQNRRF